MTIGVNIMGSGGENEKSFNTTLNLGIPIEDVCTHLSSWNGF